MADEKKTYLINIESNLKKYAEDAAVAKKTADELKASLEALKKAGATPAEIEAATAASKNANAEYAKAAKLVQIQTAANNSEKNSRKQLGEILNLQMQALGKLGNAYITNAKGVRELNPLYIEQRKRIAETKQAILDYDKSLNDGRSNIGRYGEAVKGAIGQAASSIFAFAAPVAVATAALNELIEAFKGTEAGANLMGRAKIQMDAFFGAIVTGKLGYAFGNQLPKDMKVVGDLMDQMRIKERSDIVILSEKELEIKNLRIDAVKAGKDSIKQIEILTQAETKQTELIAFKLESKQEELKITNLILDKAPTNTAALNKQAQLEAEINSIKGEGSLRIAAQIETAEEKTLANIEKRKKAEEDAAKKKTDEVNKLAKLRQEALLAEIEDDDKRAIQKLSFDRDDQIRVAKNTDEIYLIWEKYYAELVKLTREQTKKRTDIEWDESVKTGKLLYDQSLKNAKEIWDALLRTEEIKDNTDKSRLENLLKNNLITKKDYLRDAEADELLIAERDIKNTTELEARKAEIREFYAQLEIDRSKEVQKQITDAVFQGVQQGADAVFNIKKNNLQASLEAELQKENQHTEKLLENKELTEKQKTLIEEQGVIQTNAIKKKYAEEGKAMAIGQALINGAIGITKTFAEYGFTPPGWIAAALLAVSTAAQIAVIAAQKFDGGGGGGSLPTAISSSAPAQRTFAQSAGSTILTQPQLSQTQLNALPQQGLLTAADIAAALSKMPPPVVTVEDINAKTAEVKKVSVRATI